MVNRRRFFGLFAGLTLAPAAVMAAVSPEKPKLKPTYKLVPRESGFAFGDAPDIRLWTFNGKRWVKVTE